MKNEGIKKHLISISNESWPIVTSFVWAAKVQIHFLKNCSGFHWMQVLAHHLWGWWPFLPWNSHHGKSVDKKRNCPDWHFLISLCDTRKRRNETRAIRQHDSHYLRSFFVWLVSFFVTKMQQQHFKTLYQAVKCPIYTTRFVVMNIAQLYYGNS